MVIKQKREIDFSTSLSKKLYNHENTLFVFERKTLGRYKTTRVLNTQLFMSCSPWGIRTPDRLRIESAPC